MQRAAKYEQIPGDAPELAVFTYGLDRRDRTIGVTSHGLPTIREHRSESRKAQSLSRDAGGGVRLVRVDQSLRLIVDDPVQTLVDFGLDVSRPV